MPEVRSQKSAPERGSLTRSGYAIVSRDGFDVPLIGIPAEAALETCECCGEIIGLSKAVFTGTQVLCPKCA
jgi:hypothetical protein